jgi:hypothetical protein
MKTKVARKAVRRAKPVKRHTRGKKQARPTAPGIKKETFEPVGAEPQIVESTADLFEAPVEFVLADPEPVVDVVEIFEVAVVGDENEE